MTTKKLFTFKDSWPWVLVTALVVGAYIKAILWAIAHTADLTGLIVVGVVVAVFLGIMIARYVARYRNVRRWNSAYHTKSGAAIISEVDRPAPVGAINDVCEEAIVVWTNWGMFGDMKTKSLANALDGCTILLVPYVLERGNPSWYVKALGLQEGEQISVTYTKDMDLSTVLGLVRHEVSHRCLEVLGVPPGLYGTNHHEIFSNTKYC